VSSERLVGLDVFRGITIAAMLLVNNPGSWTDVYAPLLHAPWHGCTPTDLVFPFFLFIVGVAIPLALERRRAAGARPGSLLAKALRRSLLLLALGLFLSGFPRFDLANLRIPGVLQRIAATYLAGCALYLATGVRGRAIAAAALLLGYWAAMRLVSVPGFGAGNLAPEANLAAYLDREILGTAHLWKSSRTWDPEGILSTVPAVATVLLGTLAGSWLRSPRPAREKIGGLFLAGTAGIGLGLAWSPFFPINKSLWTSSYVLFTGGCAAVALGACYGLVDVRGWRRGLAPFRVFGTNAIAVFVLSGLLARILSLVEVPRGGERRALKVVLYESLFASWAPPKIASLGFAAATVLFWLLPMGLLYRKRIFLRL
jgi:predicted acyltransferase